MSISVASRHRNSYSLLMETNTTPRPKMTDCFRTAAIVRGPKWNPVALPWRVSYCRPSMECGYMHETAVFATESEAQAAFMAIMPKGAYYAEIHQAVNPSSWQENGSWKRIAKRKPGKVPA